MITLAECQARDAADPLGPVRARFAIPPGLVYLDGNSLGALPAATAASVAHVIEAQWGRDLIASWNKHGWIDAPARAAAAIAPIVGATPQELLVADTASINLFKLVAGALALRPGRRAIVTEAGSFPTDIYMLEGLRSLIPDLDLRILPPGQVQAALDTDTALLLLNHVHYKTGRRWNMQALNDAAHAVGALTLWDVCHSAGAIALDFCGTNTDLAVGCGYKFLNGGPGAPSFLFVALRHQEKITNPLAGWLGHATPFSFDPEYQPAEGIRRMLCSSPSILAIAALEAGLSLWQGIAPASIEAKTASLGDVFIELVEALTPAGALALVSPRDACARGAQIAFSHPDAFPIMQCLIARGIVGDFREPDILRFGLAPLTTTHVDLHTAATTLADILSSRDWRQDRYAVRQQVT